MGQHPSLMAGDGSVGVMSTTTITPPCKGVESTDQSNGIHSDKGSALSFRTAIDNFIESCLSNPSGNGENSQDETDSKPDCEDKPENKNNEENESKNESTDSNEPFEKDAPLSTDNATEESLDKAKTFGSYLQTRIRDMIVNCENNEDLTSYSGNQKPTSTSDSSPGTHTTSPSISTTSVSTINSTTSNTTVNVTHSSTVTSLVPNSTMHAVSTPSVAPVQSVSSKTLSSIYNKSEKSNATTSVPLQALIDKVLDNSLGDESPPGKLSEPRIIDAITSSSNSQPESKQKNSGSYEIAAESANFVREKVTRCVERNVNNAENSSTKSEKQTSVLFMDHIEKVLVENFAEMNKKENMEKGVDREEQPRKNIPPAPSTIPNTADTESRMRQPRGEAPVSTESTIKHQTHGNFVMNPDGSNSVQSIVDRVISQTEVISKLLTPGSKQAHTAAVNRHPDKTSASNRPVKEYERVNSRINSSHSQKTESYNEHIRQKDYHRPTELQKSTGFHPYHPREEYPKHSIVVSAGGNNFSEQQARYTQALSEKQMYHKGGLYPPSEVQDLHHVDQRLISETQRQKMIQENMAYISSRYPYHLNMPESGILPHHSMLRYCPPGAILPQRMPPPLLRIDGLMETGASTLVPHPYSKSCACMNCSAHRVQLEEVKKSPKQMSHGLLVPSSSNSFQSRLSPSSKELKHGGTHSPLRFHNSAFTRTKDIAYSERGTPSKAHYDDSPKQKKSRIDYGINMLYCDKRRQPETYGISVREPSPSKNKYMPVPHSRLPDIHGPPEIKTPAIDTSLSNDQPLDLTKKKPKPVEGQSQDYYRWQRGSHESAKNSYSHVPNSSHERRVASVEITGYGNEYHSPDKQFTKYHEREREFPVHYGSKQETNRVQETSSASMTPGMMPEQLGSPGGRRPQLHPLPSPNLSTSYTQAPPTLNFPNSMSPTNSSEGERNNESLNISRPPSQCSSNSPFDQDKDRRGSVSRHEPIQNIIGTHPPNDILYLICRLCRQTYGSPYGFRKHFRNQHGFEPRAEHTIVQTISATKSAMLHTPGMPNSPNGQNPNSVHGLHPQFQEGQVLDLADMPKVRERAASDSRLMKSSTYSETKSSRPTGSRSAEYRRPSLKDESDNTKFLQCEQCKQTFQLNDFGSYKRHCRQHNQSRNLGAFHCQLCPSSFQEPQQLQEHMVKHDVESVVCKYCKVPYASRIYLEDHLRKVHGEETKTSNSCRHCQMSFIDYSEFLIHLQKVHGGLLSSEGANEKNAREDYQTKVSSVHVDIQPADQLTVVTCPDSSSDYSSVNKDNCKVTNSLSDLKQTDSIKGTSGNETASQDRCASVETRSYSNENSQDTVSSLANSDTGEESFYKHKKFFGHRKRKESSDVLSVSPKCPRTDDGGSPKFNEVTSNANTKITSSSTFTSDSEKSCDTTAFNSSSVNSNNMCSLDTDRLQNKHEARHQMPFVWDRVTRSQAGKNIKPPDYMA